VVTKPPINTHRHWNFRELFSYAVLHDAPQIKRVVRFFRHSGSAISLRSEAPHFLDQGGRRAGRAVRHFVCPFGVALTLTTRRLLVNTQTQRLTQTAHVTIYLNAIMAKIKMRNLYGGAAEAGKCGNLQARRFYSSNLPDTRSFFIIFAKLQIFATNIAIK